MNAISTQGLLIYMESDVRASLSFTKSIAEGPKLSKFENVTKKQILTSDSEQKVSYILGSESLKFADSDQYVCCCCTR